jgi:hypothetical protein
MPYNLEGRLLEVCTCKILCPCWVGEDPDFGTCDGVLGWHFDKGTIDGTDVAGRTLVVLAHIPGNILKGNWRVRVYLDDKTSPAQKDALLKVWTGKAGGPVADLVKLVGSVEAVEEVPITFDIQGATGVLKVGQAIEATLAPFQGATGKATAMHDTIFTTIPGSPAYVGKAESYRATAPGFNVNLKGHNAVSGSFRFVA